MSFLYWWKVFHGSSVAKKTLLARLNFYTLWLMPISSRISLGLNWLVMLDLRRNVLIWILNGFWFVFHRRTDFADIVVLFSEINRYSCQRTFGRPVWGNGRTSAMYWRAAHRMGDALYVLAAKSVLTDERCNIPLNFPYTTAQLCWLPFPGPKLPKQWIILH